MWIKYNIGQDSLKVVSLILKFLKKKLLEKPYPSRYSSQSICLNRRDTLANNGKSSTGNGSISCLDIAQCVRLESDISPITV